MKLNSIVFEPIAGLSGWYSAQRPQPDCYPLIDQALQMQTEALAQGFYCICGMRRFNGYDLYLAPKKGVRSILEVFETGSHGGEDADGVFKQISEADALNPLVPYFADEAGLKAKFSKPVTSQLIEILERTVTAGEIMMSDDDGSIGEFVEANKEVQLWWD